MKWGINGTLQIFNLMYSGYLSKVEEIFSLSYHILLLFLYRHPAMELQLQTFPTRSYRLSQLSVQIVEHMFHHQWMFGEEQLPSRTHRVFDRMPGICEKLESKS